LTESTLAARLSVPELPAAVKSVVVLESPSGEEPGASPRLPDTTIEKPAAPSRIAADVDPIKPVQNGQRPSVAELWDQEMQGARAQLEPDGALVGATRELQAGLAKFMQFCHQQGLKAGPWRLTHIVEEMTFSDHPTYGALSLAHWVCKNSQPWKVGIGL